MSEDRAMSAPDREKLRALADRYARTLAIFEDTDVFGMQRHYVEEEIGAAVAPLLSAILDALEGAAPRAATEPPHVHDWQRQTTVTGEVLWIRCLGCGAEPLDAIPTSAPEPGS